MSVPGRREDWFVNFLCTVLAGLIILGELGVWQLSCLSSSVLSLVVTNKQTASWLGVWALFSENSKIQERYADDQWEQNEKSSKLYAEISFQSTRWLSSSAAVLSLLHSLPLQRWFGRLAFLQHSLPSIARATSNILLLMALLLLSHP